jgi:hypothetical protein
MSLFLACGGLGDIVVNPRGEELGRLEHVMLDAGSGTIVYVVLARGGVLGLGEKLFAVPWSSFVLDRSRQRLVLDMECERLERSPGFTPETWPMAQPDGPRSL